MVSHRIRIVQMLMVTLLFGITGVLLAMPVTAFAAPDEIMGCDHVFAGQEAPEDGEMDILTVSGSDGETVYLEIRQADGRIIASHLCYTLQDDGTTDEDGKVVGVVSVKSAAGILLDGATVKVYEDRAQSQIVWDGVISTVYARLGHGDEATEVPLAMRAIGNNEERQFMPPGTLRHGSAVYALTSDSPTIDDGRTCYGYEISEETPASVDGRISYYDSKGSAEPIKVDTVRDIAFDTSRKVSIPDVIVVEGHAYRTIQLAEQVTLSYPGTTEYSVQCLKLESSSWGSQGSFYKAKINYVDADGRTLGITDSVIVDRRYLYTPPTRLHVRGDDDTFSTYVLSADNDLSDGGAIVLEPGQAEGSRDIDVVYEPLADNAERTWTVVLVNGSVAPGDPAREIGRVTYRGKPGKTVTHPTDATINVDGVTLVPVSCAEDSYEHTFKAAESQIEQVIYYVPDGWTEPDAYEIKVNYVNIATNGVISSESYTASPTMRRDLEIATPPTFDKGDTKYVRLNGQGLAIRHSFYSPNRTYNVYYRESGDDLHTKTIIRSVRIEYIDPETGGTVYRPTTGSPQGSSGTSDGGVRATSGAGAGAASRQTTRDANTAAGEGTPRRATTETPSQTASDTPAPIAPAAAETETGIGTNSDLVSIIDDETPRSLVTNDGSDLATVRIEDNETPMTSGSEVKDTPDPMPLGFVAGIVAAAIAATGTLLFVAWRRRRGGDTILNGSNQPSYGGR